MSGVEAIQYAVQEVLVTPDFCSEEDTWLTVQCVHICNAALTLHGVLQGVCTSSLCPRLTLPDDADFDRATSASSGSEGTEPELAMQWLDEALSAPKFARRLLEARDALLALPTHAPRRRKLVFVVAQALRLLAHMYGVHAHFLRRKQYDVLLESVIEQAIGVLDLAADDLEDDELCTVRERLEQLRSHNVLALDPRQRVQSIIDIDTRKRNERTRQRAQETEEVRQFLQAAQGAAGTSSDVASADGVGVPFLKFRYSLRGKPQRRLVKVDLVTRDVCWRSNSRSYWKSVSLHDVHSVCAGKRTAAFRDNSVAKDADANLCFSIVSRRRTLDLQAESAQMCEQWVRGLQLLLKHHKGALDATVLKDAFAR